MEEITNKLPPEYNSEALPQLAWYAKSYVVTSSYAICVNLLFLCSQTVITIKVLDYVVFFTEITGDYT